MHFILHNPDIAEALYPFSILSTYADIRIGLWTNKERYRQYLGEAILMDKDDVDDDTIFAFVNAAYIPDRHLVDIVASLKENEAVVYQDECVALCLSKREFKGFSLSHYQGLHFVKFSGDLRCMKNPFDIVRLNRRLLSEDIHELTPKKITESLSNDNKIIGAGRIWVGEGSSISGSYLNVENGPIYIGSNVQIMEGACLRGPIAILDNAIVKMGTTIYGCTTIGENCIVGGEIKNSVFFDYSNKAHHGYIGDSVIGTWCNLGAGTSCSNIKNNAGDLQLWNPLLKKSVNVGMKCGVMMGDHTRTAINTSINSGTVTGIGCNIIKAGFPPKYIPDFTWNVETGELYRETKLLEDVHNWMKMKNEKLDEKNKRLLLQHYHNCLNTNR
jgi:UDP-N-acetylglucosamine diphosphorylase/glucosamine-1-phosphate N-acetyltransferase